MTLFFYCEVLFFITVVLMNVVKKNSLLVFLYVIQSITVTSVILFEAVQSQSIELAITGLLVFAIKVVCAPIFFLRFVKKSQLNLSTATFLNIPLTLAIMLGIIAFAYSEVFAPIQVIVGGEKVLGMMAIASICMSFFVLINRKGALSQIIGILSLENAIVALSIFLKFNQTIAIELGILFNILVWIVVAYTFLDLVHADAHAGDVTELHALKK